MKKIILVFVIVLTGILLLGCSKNLSDCSGEYVLKGTEVQTEPLRRYYVEISKEEKSIIGYGVSIA